MFVFNLNFGLNAKTRSTLARLWGAHSGECWLSPLFRRWLWHEVSPFLTEVVELKGHLFYVLMEFDDFCYLLANQADLGCFKSHGISILAIEAYISHPAQTDFTGKIDA